MLSECLKSVFSTIGTLEVEVFVVDNASTDGSAEMVETQFPFVTLIKNTENKGFASANNQAISLSKGRYILLLNSDTVVHDIVICKCVEYMDQNLGVGVMGCRVLNTDGTLQPTCSQYPTLGNLVLLTSGLWRLPWPMFLDRYQMRRWKRTDQRDVEVVSGCFMLVRASAIEEIGMLDERFFFFGEETDWCNRFQQAGWRLRFAPVGEITHHGGGSVRKLDYKRDLMLSSAMVALHLKHGGRVAGISAYVIVLVFNLSRALFWTAATCLLRSEHAKTRSRHFLSLLRNSARVWPTNKTFTP